MVFDIFQKGYGLYSAACMRHRNEGEMVHEYVASMFNRDEEFKVLFNVSDNTVSCSCRKFKTFGMLCCHALKILV